MSTNPFDDSAEKNPYASPTGMPSNFSGGSPPPSKVQAPAIGLMVIGGLAAVLSALLLILNLAGVGLGAAGLGGDQEQFQLMAQGTMGVVQCLIGVVFGGVIIYGGMQMYNMQSYGLAMTASIMAMLPCTPCCICLGGLPVGIWAVVVLNDPMVKAAFKS